MSSRDFLRQTDVQPRPEISASAPGWDRERAWSGHDDWEPLVAADRFSAFVYQMVTRFSPSVSGIFIRRSADGGATWLPDQLVAPINVWQADPQVQVSDDGTVFAVWLRWPGLGIEADQVLRPWRDLDAAGGDRAVATLDRSPWLLVSPDGKDVYVGLNMDDSYIVTSHDGGQTFGAPFKTNPLTRGHWWDANGAAMAPDGTPYFVVINFFLDYRGPAEINVISSRDHGATWQTTLVDTSAPPPGCKEAAGCDYGFLSSTAGLAIDRNGKMMLAYHAGDVAKEPQEMFVSTSDDGVNWTPRFPISQPNDGASNGFPSIAAGPTAGDFRLVWQGNENGNPRGWNTFYRQTTDGGQTWSPIVKLSNRANGAPYKSLAGYFFPYWRLPEFVSRWRGKELRDLGRRQQLRRSRRRLVYARIGAVKIVRSSAVKDRIRPSLPWKRSLSSPLRPLRFVA